MNISFVKMQGIGNDFVVLSPFLDSSPIEKLTKENFKFISNRHLGVGADQILIVRPCASSEADYEFRIVNSDGTEVEQCGNGARCVMRFLFEMGIHSKSKAKLKTKGGIVEAVILDETNIRIQMTVPKFNANDVGLDIKSLKSRKINQQKVFLIPWKKMELNIFPVSMGNPHGVINVESITDPDIEEITSLVKSQKFFLNGVNLGFCKILSPKKIKLRVFERGVGETLACGSGACAAVVAGVAQGFLAPNEPIEVNLTGGKLIISWAGKLNDFVFMAGPAVEVFKGKIKI